MSPYGRQRRLRGSGHAGPPPDASAGRSGTGPLGIGGWIFIGLAVLLVLGGAGAIAIHLTERDSDGYYSSSADRVKTPAYAVTATGIDLNDNVGAKVAQELLGRVRIRATPARGHPVFIGIAREGDLNRYLGRVARSQVTDINGSNVSYRERKGGPPAAPPGRQGFWQASASGSGTQTITWKVREGNWAVAIMNADAAPGVGADVSVAARSTAVLWVGVGLLALGLLFAGIGAAMVVADRRKRTAPAA